MGRKVSTAERMREQENGCIDRYTVSRYIFAEYLLAGWTMTSELLRFSKERSRLHVFKPMQY